MPYRFIEEEATADIAFEATGNSLRDVFRAAVEATLEVMIDNPESIEERETRSIELNGKELDLLLFELLQKIIFYKDAERLLLRIADIKIELIADLWRLSAVGRGEYLDPKRHHFGADVKAVTLHRFRLEQLDKEWRAHVILDI